MYITLIGFSQYRKNTQQVIGAALEISSPSRLGRVDQRHKEWILLHNDEIGAT
jgi:hypothetical protein